MDTQFFKLEPHSNKLETYFLPMSIHSLKLIAHRKKMEHQFLSMASPFVIRRASYQNRAGPLVPMELILKMRMFLRKQ